MTVTAKKPATKRIFRITLMRPVFQVAVLQVEATSAERAAELAVERESSLKEDEWNGPFERAAHDDGANDPPPFVFRSISGVTPSTDSQEAEGFTFAGKEHIKP
ncbi:MAG: hypothetical protein KGL02_05610 [Acidobacteriota bacterium]|nr:hypothetical protein [Acidobacteriota bacterium]